MLRCAFLSMDSLAGYETSDPLLVAPMAAASWQVETVSWRDPSADWNRFDAVVVRTPWDYQDDLAGFTATLDTIDASRARLANDRALMGWNLDKRYLRDLAARGVATVPTHWADTFDAANVADTYAAFNTGEIVIKPTVAAGARDTFRLTPAALEAALPTLMRLFADRPHMIQPFAPDILTEGEFSLFYFGGRYSHAIRKIPKPGDFRVQEEHGGILSALTPDPALRAAADTAMNALDAPPLYARVDLVRWRTNPVLIEFELVEPSLYLDHDPRAPQRFVDAFLDWYKTQPPSS